MKSDIDIIRKSLALTCKPGMVYELRTVGKNVFSGFFDDFDKMAAAANQVSGTAHVDGVYATINPVNDALLGRANNKIKQADSGMAASDKDVVRRTTFLIDVDSATRPKGVSATDEEKKTAYELTLKIREWTQTVGWPTPMLADSGNGYHLRFHIDLPNTDESKKLVETCLKALAHMFNNGVDKVDTSVFNASRICKIYGTLSAKGDSTATRPHRICTVLEEGSDVVVSQEQLQLLAEQFKDDAKPKEAFTSNGQITKTVANGLVLKQVVVKRHNWTTADMESFLLAYNVAHDGASEYQNGYKWQLAHCPFDESHTSPDSVVYIFPSEEDGAWYPTFKCSHDSCSEPRWRMFVNKLKEINPDVKFGFDDGYDIAEEIAEAANFGVKLRLRKFSKIKAEHIEWLWEDFIPLGKLTLFAGHPGVGKGVITVDIASTASNGTQWVTGPNTTGPVDVLILSSEDSAGDTIKPRLMAAGADMERVYQIEGVTRNGVDKQFTLDTDILAIQDALKENPNIKLIIIDPITNHLGDVSMYKEQELRNVMSPLAALAEQYKLAIILVAHFNKDKTKDAVQRVAGAQAMTGVVRMAWAFAQAEGSTQGKMLPLKMNIAKYAGGIEYETVGVPIEIDGVTKEYPKISWGQVIKDSTSLAIGGIKQDSTKLQAAQTFLATWLSNGIAMAEEEIENLAKMEHWHSKPILDAAAASLKIQKKNIDGVWKWSLPDNTKAASSDL